MDVLCYYDSDLKLLLLGCFSFAHFQFAHTCKDNTSIHEQLLIRADPCITAVVWYEVTKTNKTTDGVNPFQTKKTSLINRKEHKTKSHENV